LFLKNVLVTDLVEYTQSESNYQAGSEFDDDAGDGDDTPAEKPAKAAKPAKAKVAKEAAEDEDTPF
jgi:hypothetical protein